MSTRHFLRDDDLTPSGQSALLDLAAECKRDRIGLRTLSGPRCVAVIFEKASTRTRLSFEVGVAELGGHAVVLDAASSQIGRGETIEDTGRTLSGFVDAIVIRTFGQQRLEALAGAATVPVINALTDEFHPCQTLADLLTVREVFGSTAGRTLTFLGDGGSNVAHSTLLGGAMAGLHVRVASPQGYAPDEAILADARAAAEVSGGSVTWTEDARAACEGADVLYTDVWTSMGQEAEASLRLQALEGYRLDDKALDLAGPDAVVMHCLPAHRGEEISAGAIDGTSSRVWQQAENRLHVQKAVLHTLLVR